MPRRLSFRDRFYTRKTARAITSPLGILAAGAGVAGGILLGVPLAGALGLGAAAWAGRVLLGMPNSNRGADVDPFTLSDPWRHYVTAAQSSKARFDRTVKAMRAGPLRDRMTDLGHRLDTGISEAWRVASRGDDLDGALRELNPNLVRTEVAQAQAMAPGPGKDATLKSLNAQWESIQRLSNVREDASNHLRSLDAKLDELVARAVELSVTGSDDLSGMSTEVEAMVSDMESLRQALEETRSVGSMTLPDLGSTSPPQSLPRS